MALTDIVKDDASGNWSHTKVWSNLGNVAMTTIFFRVAWNAQVTDGLAWLFLVYGGLVAGSQVASKIIGLRWGGKNGNGTRKGKK